MGWKMSLYLLCMFLNASIDCLVQDCSNSIANALELLQSCTKPWLWHNSSWPSRYPWADLDKKAYNCQRVHELFELQVWSYTWMVGASLIKTVIYNALATVYILYVISWHCNWFRPGGVLWLCLFVCGILNKNVHLGWTLMTGIFIFNLWFPL